MNTKQHIYNESDNYEFKTITSKYYVEPDMNSKWNHRDVEYNDAGTPIIRLYVGEIKQVFKDTYVNGVKNNLSINNKLELESFEGISNGETICKINSKSSENWITIHAINTGVFILTPDITGMYDINIYPDLRDTDVILIVEKEPTIISIKWGHDNPLILYNLEYITLSIKALYDNGQEREINKYDLEQLNVISSNQYAIKISSEILNDEFSNFLIKPFDYTEKCQISITNESLKKIFGDNVKNVEPLTIIVKGDEDEESIINAEFVIEYEKEIPLLTENDEYKICILGVYKLSDGTILKRYDISNEYTFKSHDESILTLNSNIIQPKKIGSTQVTATINNINDFSNIPTTLTWNVKIIKRIERITWNIDSTNLSIGLSPAIISVIAYYENDTYEDISESCSFKYDSNYIEIQRNKVIPVAPGYSELSIESIVNTNNDELIPKNKFKINVIQPITKMHFSKHYLDLKVGDKETLEFLYKPDNATSMKLNWMSSNPEVISVDSNGCVEALKRGSADIIVTTYNKSSINLEDYEIPPEDNKNIYLPLGEISANIDTNGIAKIKILDAILYSVKLYDSEKNIITGNVVYRNADKQSLDIYIQCESLITYDKTLYAEVTNFYGEMVYTMPITIYLKNSNDELLDTIYTETDKNGIAVIQSLNKTFTNNEGIAKIDGIIVHATHDNMNIANIEINHEEKTTIAVTISNLYLDAMTKLRLYITNDADEGFRKNLTHIKVKVYYVSNNKKFLIFNDYPDMDGIVIIDSNDKILDDKNTDEFFNHENIITNLMEYNPTQCAICQVTSTAIDVTKIKFKYPAYNVDVDDTNIPLEVIITPENATFKDCSFIVEDTKIAKLTKYNELYGYCEGVTKVKAILNDNTEIYDEVPVTVTNRRLKSIKICNGNDTDYEWYDNLNQLKYYTTDGEYVTAGMKVTNEQYDDDDINRFYLPVNNSLQLSATCIPDYANNTDIKWLSSDSNLVKVNDKGIITAVRYGNQELDVYGDNTNGGDSVSETRFANTVWVSAINTKYKKYDVCQVRVTRNKITAIEISNTTEHDYNEDDILPSGIYDLNAEHEFDYVINVGETISIPVTLSVQDENFGTSDYIKWAGSSNVHDIVEINNISPNHTNAFDDEFDWNVTTPNIVNLNKNLLELKVTGIGIGDTYIYAMQYDNVRDISKPQLYVPEETMVVEIPENGIANLDNKFGIERIRVEWFSKKCTFLHDFKQAISKILENVKCESSCIINGTVVIDEGVNKLDEVIDDTYVATKGLPVIGAKCMLNPNGSIKIIIPENCRIENLKTGNENSMPISFNYVPTIDRIGEFDKNGNLDLDNTLEYIKVTLYGVNNTKHVIPIFLDAILDVSKTRRTRKLFAFNTVVDNMNDDETINSISYFPSSDEITNLMTSDIGNQFDARPGMGTWIDGAKSRKVKIRVVATPKKLNIGWINAYNDELQSINTIKTNTITVNKWSKNKYRYMAIGYDEEFKLLLEDAKLRNEELAEKYKSFAWFSDNEDVIRFEDVEDLDYKDSNGEYTNDPNENYQQIITNPVVTLFSNINTSNYTGYKEANPIAKIKLSNEYIYVDNNLATNNTDLCIIKLTAPDNGRFCIRHSGTLQYDTVESFSNNPKTISVKLGYADNYIYAKKGDVIYVKGGSSTIVYIQAIYYYQNEVGPGFWGSTMEKVDKTPSDYKLYKDIFLLKLPDDSREYSSNDGIALYNEKTAIKFTPTCDATMKITFSGHSIKIKSSHKNAIVNATSSPYEFKVYKDTEYIISGINDNVSTIKSIEYTNIIKNTSVRRFKGTNEYTVKPSYMKRIICEGIGTARIYVLSPKGQALVNITMNIE